MKNRIAFLVTLSLIVAVARTAIAQEQVEPSSDPTFVAAALARFTINIDGKCGLPQSDGGMSSAELDTIALRLSAESFLKYHAETDSLQIILAKAAGADIDCAEAKNYRAVLPSLIKSLVSSPTAGDVPLVAPTSAVVVGNGQPTKSTRTNDTVTKGGIKITTMLTDMKGRQFNRSDMIAYIQQRLTPRTGAVDTKAAKKQRKKTLRALTLFPRAPEAATVIALDSSAADVTGKLDGSALYVRETPIPLEQSYFAVLGSFETKKSALIHAADLQRALAGLRTAVYPPRGKYGYWIVVAASFATLPEAEGEARAAKASGIATDAYAWSAWRHSARLNSAAFKPLPESLAPKTWPRLLTGTEPDADAAYYVSLASAPTPEAALEAKRGLQEAQPGLPLAIYPLVPGVTDWQVMMAARIGKERAEETINLVKNMGLPGEAKLISLPLDQMKTWIAKDPDVEAAAIGLKEKIDKCQENGNIRQDSMQRCLGGFLSKEAFVACVDFISPQASSLPAEAASVACHLEPLRLLSPADASILLQPSVIDIQALPEARVAELMACKERYPDPTANNDFVKCALALRLSPEQQKAFDCLAKPGAEAAGCILSQDSGIDSAKALALYNCASKDGADLARCLPNLVSEADIEKLTKPAHCIETAKSEKDILACTKKFGVDTKGLDCIEQAGSEQKMALKCIAAKDPTLKSIADAGACLEKAGTDNVKRAACASKVFGQDKAVTKAAACAALTDAERVSCLVKATGLGKDAEKAATLTTCLGDAAKGADEHATCLATAAGLDKGRAKIALCLASGKSALDCAAGDEHLSQGVTTYKCASAAGDAADMLENCSEALNFGDKKTVKTAACLARSQGDSTKIGMCAASNVLNLTDDQRRLLDCAAVSQGAVEYALCISGVNMNAEFRMAAQCVASTGGEPMSSASCTAGRLSIREFQKCAASGMKIGSDDCFGKNNTIRKYYEQLADVYIKAGETVVNDLTRGPGKNHIIVAAVRDVEVIAKDAQARAMKAIEDVAKGVVHVEEEARKVAENAAAAAQKAAEDVKKVLDGAANAVVGAIQSFGNAISNCCRF